MKGQKSLQMIIGMVMLLVVAGVTISMFINVFQEPDLGESTQERQEIQNQCAERCNSWKQASGDNSLSAALEYCTAKFERDVDGDGSTTDIAGSGYNSYCEDGVKCFNIHTCEIGQQTLNAERCKQIMTNYYTSSEIDLSTSEANNRIGEWYQPNGEGDKTIGTCGLQDIEEATWYSENFQGIAE